MLRSESLPEVAAEVLKGLQTLVPAWHYSVGQVDGVRERYKLVHAVGPGADLAPVGQAMPLRSLPFELSALRTGVVLSTPSASGRTRKPPKRKAVPGTPKARDLFGDSVGATVVVPVRESGLLVATVNLASRDPEPFNAEQIQVVCSLSELVADGHRRELQRQELLQALNRAHAANEAKSRFLNTGHELRTPLNGIIGYLELLDETRGENNLTDVYEVLGRVHASAKHLLSVINTLLDFAKIEAGKMDLTLTTVDLAEMVDNLGSMVAPLVAQRSNHWEAECPEAVWVLGDALKLRQTLLNLVGNAAKFTDGGTVGIRVTTRDDVVLIEVHDTGQGIPEERLSTLFDPFVQAHGAEVGGTGLGLAITKRYVEMMNGTIRVTSEVGQGSCFGIEMLRVRPIDPS